MGTDTTAISGEPVGISGGAHFTKCAAKVGLSFQPDLGRLESLTPIQHAPCIRWVGLPGRPCASGAMRSAAPSPPSSAFRLRSSVFRVFRVFRGSPIRVYPRFKKFKKLK
jgi:hypothetical protein